MKKVLKVVFSLLALVLILIIYDAWLLHFHVPSEPYWESKSPDGRFAVSVYYNPGIFYPLPPGLQPRGAIGTVVLRNIRTGKVLQREPVDYVDEGVPQVRWHKETNSVGVVSVGAWDLPQD
jgi:hypothetical protein